MNMTQGI